MTDPDDDSNDDELVLDASMEAPEDGGDDDDHGSIEPEGEDEFVLALEDEEPGEEETSLVKHLRDELRDTKRELSERRKADAPKIEVGKKPDLWEDCEGDADKYDEAVDAWKERKLQAERQEKAAAEQNEVLNREFQRKLDTYRGKLEALPIPAEAKQAAEDAVRKELPVQHQSALIMYADDPAKVVAALHKYPTKLSELAAEPDVVRFVLAVKQLEGKLTVKKRNAPPPESETVLRGSAAMSLSSDKEMAKLEREADRTGDRTKLIAYRAQKRAKAA